MGQNMPIYSIGNGLDHNVWKYTFVTKQTDSFYESSSSVLSLFNNIQYSTLKPSLCTKKGDHVNFQNIDDFYASSEYWSRQNVLKSLSSLNTQLKLCPP